MVLLEFAMSPQGQGESLSAHVARILDVIDKRGVAYQLTPMGTILAPAEQDREGRSAPRSQTAHMKEVRMPAPACSLRHRRPIRMARN
jgi:hypothetical protein